MSEQTMSIHLVGPDGLKYGAPLDVLPQELPAGMRLLVVITLKDIGLSEIPDALVLPVNGNGYATIQWISDSDCLITVVAGSIRNVELLLQSCYMSAGGEVIRVGGI